jgi:hypothetical protein
METFVDTERFKDACYKAANGNIIGRTQGLGRYDRHTKRELSVKELFVTPL